MAIVHHIHCIFILHTKFFQGNSNLYQADNGFSCQLCKKGEYLQKACEINQGPSTCKFCPRNTFMDKDNNYTYCIDCRPCHGGQELITECTRVSNDICQCPVGKYWVQALGHDGQCYNHSVCKDGEVVVAEGKYL
ncbi:hypothetical protein LOTGIDRAFT_105312 [Lottia gigantea]|uniref:TNFR-Cys domain-containing protein n=1 Tax=Lottia gigantea TaxID=225164 RepID=V4BQF6_LOTGI|nr:hypothetical protein LOTGIDRAFT_105312 [Lottia gigantea]ESO91114.1 hypothetical protein LOTGIDRAFT_105312 [Lottia gigantea]